MSTPTPGPWRWVEYDNGAHLMDGDREVLEIYESHGGGNQPTPEDARLIAAAPELLAALKHAIAVDTEMWRERGETPLRTPEFQESYDLAVAAIKKADGNGWTMPSNSPPGRVP